MAQSYKVVAFAGSLRKESINRLLLRSAISLAPAEMSIHELYIHDMEKYTEPDKTNIQQTKKSLEDNLNRMNKLYTDKRNII